MRQSSDTDLSGGSSLEHVTNASTARTRATNGARARAKDDNCMGAAYPGREEDQLLRGQEGSSQHWRAPEKQPPTSLSSCTASLRQRSTSSWAAAQGTAHCATVVQWFASRQAKSAWSSFLHAVSMHVTRHLALQLAHRGFMSTSAWAHSASAPHAQLARLISRVHGCSTSSATSWS